jgi:hypothetical protein
VAKERDLGCSDRIMGAPAQKGEASDAEPTGQEGDASNAEPTGQEGDASDAEPTAAQIAFWDVDVVFWKLASMGVTYIGAADMLERYSMKSKKLQTTIFWASFIAVKQPNVEDVTWTGIERAMKSLSFQQNDIDNLKSAIDERSNQGRLSPVFQKFTVLKNKGKFPWKVVYHCEAILAILMTGGSIEGDLDSGFLIKVWSLFM